MSGHVVIAALSEAMHKFGTFRGREREVSQWVQRRVREIQSGSRTVAHPTTARTFERSWYEGPEREPGSDDE